MHERADTDLAMAHAFGPASDHPPQKKKKQKKNHFVFRELENPGGVHPNSVSSVR